MAGGAAAELETWSCRSETQAVFVLLGYSWCLSGRKICARFIPAIHTRFIPRFIPFCCHLQPRASCALGSSSEAMRPKSSEESTAGTLSSCQRTGALQCPKPQSKSSEIIPPSHTPNHTFDSYPLYQPPGAATSKKHIPIYRVIRLMALLRILSCFSEASASGASAEPRQALNMYFCSRQTNTVTSA